MPQPTLAIDNAANRRQHARVRLVLGQLLFGVMAACSLSPSPRFPRPTLALTPTAIEPPQLHDYTDLGPGRTAGTLVGDGEEVRFELRRGARWAEDPSPRELVLLVPILAGGKELMSLIAERLVDEGFDVAFCERAGRALKPPQRAADLDELFRRTVLHQRMLLRWLRDSGEPPTATHLLGLSMGGMVSTVLAAQDQGLTGIAICLSGADLADLVLFSSEPRVKSWLDWRQQIDGVGRDAVRWELGEFLTHEPFLFAPAVATEKVLFVSAALDTVVPRRNQSLLWEALGRPQRLDVPLGHYTAALALDRVIGAAADHFRTCRH